MAGWIFSWPTTPSANFLFCNQGNGQFAAKSGWKQAWPTAQDGRARSGMGVDAADFDQDGWQDLFVANVDQEMYSLYHNNHDDTFEDVASAMGIGS